MALSDLARRVRLLAFLVAGVLLTGCIDQPATSLPSDDQAANPTSPAPAPAPAPSPPRESATALEPIATDEASVFTHAEGIVMVALEIRLASKTTCTFGDAAHHGSEWRPDPDHAFDLLRAQDGTWTVEAHSGTVPYPQAHAKVGPADSRVVTNPLYTAAWGAYGTAMGFGDTFTSASWYTDYPLDAGVYRLEAVNTHAVDGGDERRLGGGSLRIGFDCAKPIEVLRAEEAPGAMFFTAMSAEGDVDVSSELGTANVHQGQRSLDAATGSCQFRMHANNPQGVVTLDGPKSFELPFNFTDNPDLSREFLRYKFPMPNGVYQVAWDLAAVENSYWDMSAACYRPVPEAQAQPSWSPPTL